jgi:hypothetical protein
MIVLSAELMSWETQGCCPGGAGLMSGDAQSCCPTEAPVSALGLVSSGWPSGDQEGVRGSVEAVADVVNGDLPCRRRQLPIRTA